MARAPLKIKVPDETEREGSLSCFACCNEMENALPTWLGVAIECSSEFVEAPFNSIECGEMGAWDEVIEICFSVNY